MLDMNIPPHSIESEQSVIGGLLLDNRAWYKVSDILTEGDFYSDAHRRIYRHIAMQIESGKECDVLTVHTSLENSNEAEFVGGLGYLAEIANNVPSAANIRRYAEAVHDASLRRKLLEISQDIGGLVYGNTPTAECIDQAQSGLGKLADYGKGRTEPRMLSEVLGMTIDTIEKAFENGGKIFGLSTGFEDLDRRIGGLRAGDYVVIAGRPSMGKTTLGLNIAENAVVEGKTAMVFSLEMGDIQLGMRTISRFGSVELDRLRTGNLTDEDFAKISVALGRVHDAKLVIDETPALTVPQMHARARRQKQRSGLDLVVIDYLGLIGAPKGQTIGNRNDEVTVISAGLKRMAKDLGVPVICLAQLSRKTDDRSDKRPMMSDLRDSGSIEQDADMIILMYRDDYYNKDSPLKGYAEANLAKHRNGEPGIVDLVFEGKYSRFLNADYVSVQHAKASMTQGKQPRRGFGD